MTLLHILLVSCFIVMGFAEGETPVNGDVTDYNTTSSENKQEKILVRENLVMKAHFNQSENMLFIFNLENIETQNMITISISSSLMFKNSRLNQFAFYGSFNSNVSLDSYDYVCLHRQFYDKCSIHIPKPVPKTLYLVAKCEKMCDEYFTISTENSPKISLNSGLIYYSQSEPTEYLKFILPAKENFTRSIIEINFEKTDLTTLELLEFYKTLNFSNQVVFEKFHYGNTFLIKILSENSCQNSCDIELPINIKQNSLYSIGFFTFGSNDLISFGSKFIDFIGSNSTNTYQYDLSDSEFETLKENGMVLKLHSFSGGQKVVCINTQNAANKVCNTQDIVVRTIELRLEKEAVEKTFNITVSDNGRAGFYTLTAHQISKLYDKKILHFSDQVFHKSFSQIVIPYTYEYWTSNDIKNLSLNLKIIQGKVMLSASLCNQTIGNVPENQESEGYQRGCKRLTFAEEESFVGSSGIYIFPLKMKCKDVNHLCILDLNFTIIPEENSFGAFYVSIRKDEEDHHPINLLLNQEYIGFFEVDEERVFQINVHKEDKANKLEFLVSEMTRMVVTTNPECLKLKNGNEDKIEECARNNQLFDGDFKNKLVVIPKEGDLIYGIFYIILQPITPGEVTLTVISSDSQPKKANRIDLIDGNPTFFQFADGNPPAVFNFISSNSNIEYNCEIFGDPNIFDLRIATSSGLVASSNNSLSFKSNGNFSNEITVTLKPEFSTFSNVTFTISITNSNTTMLLKGDRVYKQTITSKNSKVYAFNLPESVKSFSIFVLLDPTKNYPSKVSLEQILYHSLADIETFSSNLNKVNYEEDSINQLCSKVVFPCKLYLKITNNYDISLDYFMSIEVTDQSYSQLYEGVQLSTKLKGTSIGKYFFFLRNQNKDFHIRIHSSQEPVSTIVTIADSTAPKESTAFSNPFSSFSERNHLLNIRNGEFESCRRSCLVEIDLFISTPDLDSSVVTDISLMYYSNIIHLGVGEKLYFQQAGDSPHYILYSTSDLLERKSDLEFRFFNNDATLTLYGKFYDSHTFEKYPDKSNNDFVISSNFSTLTKQRLEEFTKGKEYGVLVLKTESSSNERLLFQFILYDDNIFPHELHPKEIVPITILEKSVKYFVVQGIDEFNLLISRESGLANISMFHMVNGSNLTWEFIKAELKNNSNQISQIVSSSSAELRFNKQNNYYCQNCIYIFALSGGAGEFKGTIVMNKLDSNEPESLVIEHLYVVKPKKNSMLFYEINEDNNNALEIEIESLYGNVNVYYGFFEGSQPDTYPYKSIVKKQKKTILIPKRQNESNFIKENPPNNDLNKNFSFADEDLNFKVNLKIYILIESISDQTISIKYNIKGGIRIKSGIPKLYSLLPGSVFQVGFWHLDPNMPTINFIKDSGTLDNLDLNFKFVKYEDYKNETYATTDIYPDVHVAFNEVLRMVLPGGKGYYLISMKNKNSSESVNVNVIYTSLEITYLAHKNPQYDFIKANSNKIYEFLIPGPGHIIFDVYNCKGETLLSTFESYEDLKNGNPMDEMISAMNTALRVGSEKILYLKVESGDAPAFFGITISYYKHQSEVPYYRFIKDMNDISSIWTIMDNKLLVNFTAVYCKNCKEKEEEKNALVKYYLSSSSNKTQLEYWEKCSIFGTLVALQNYQVNASSSEAFSVQYDSTDFQSNLLDTERLSDSIKDHFFKLDYPSKTPYFYQIKAVLENYYGNKAYFIYEPFELISQPNTEDFVISKWMMFLIYFFIFTALFTIVCLYRKYQKTNLRLKYEMQDLSKIGKLDHDTSLEEREVGRLGYGEMTEVR